MVSTKVEPFLSCCRHSTLLFHIKQVTLHKNIMHGYSLPNEEGIRQLGISFHLTIQSGVTQDHVTG